MKRAEKTARLIYERASERLSDPARIAELLAATQDCGATLTVAIPGRDDRYQSVILKSDGTSLWIDELAPVEGNDEIAAAEQLQIYASVCGEGVHFTTAIEGSGYKDGARWHRLAAPGAVYRLQKRAWSRIPASSARPIAVRIEPLTAREGGHADLHLPMTAKMIHGRLLDISCGGAALLLPADAGLNMGGKFRHCIIDCPGGAPVAAEIEIRHILVTRPSGLLRVSARFADTSPPEMRAIEKLIRTLERTVLRRRSRAGEAPWEPPE